MLPAEYVLLQNDVVIYRHVVLILQPSPIRALLPTYTFCPSDTA